MFERTFFNFNNTYYILCASMRYIPKFIVNEINFPHNKIINLYVDCLLLHKNRNIVRRCKPYIAL